MRKFDTYFVRPPASPEIRERSLREFEDGWGVTLPQDYRAFLMEWGGSAFRGYVLFSIRGDPPGGTTGIVEVFFGLRPGDDYDPREMSDLYKELTSPNWLPVAQDTDGNLICIGVRGPDTGRVSFYVHQQALFNRGRDQLTRFHSVADSWTEFMSSLRPDDDCRV